MAWPRTVAIAAALHLYWIIVIDSDLCIFGVGVGVGSPTTTTTTVPLCDCDREAIRSGKWLKVPTMQAQYWPAEGAWIRREATQDYQWFPAGNRGNGASSCRYEERFNSTLFCELMANSVVMFIGDSITWEMYESLAVLVESPIFPVRKVHIEATNTRGLPVVMNVCGDANVTLIYRSSKRLVSDRDSESIERMLDEQFPVAIVLNAGAHYQPDDRYTRALNHTLRLMEGWQRTCRDRGLSCPLVWRTTAQGVPDCATFQGPVNDLARMETHVATSMSFHPKWNWDKFRHQNGIALDMLRSAKTEYGLRYRNPSDIARVVDYRYNFSRVTNVRPDGMAIAFDPRNMHAKSR